MSKVLLIVNPSSGGEKAKSYEDLAREKLAECFDEVADIFDNTALVAVMEMAENHLFHPVFDKESMKSLASKESVEALEIGMIV